MGAQHTPTPWAISFGFDPRMTGEREVYVAPASGVPVGIKISTPWVEGAWQGDPEAEANARFIVRAVNCHDELLAALEGDIDWLDALSQMTIERDTVMVRILAHRALIAKARGEVA